MEETYKIDVICTNCNFKKKIELPKGTTVTETECPKCGCKKLETISKDIAQNNTTDYSSFWGEDV